MNQKITFHKLMIIVTGGGSGGHITPILSVAHELKKQQPDCQIIYIGYRGDKVASLVAGSQDIDHSYKIFAGKLRRYHGHSLISQLLDLKSQFLNLRDVIYLLVGYFQALWLLGRLKPNVLFVKGGFVGVPLAMAARAWHVPYITHDSDVVPGLANRLVAKKASFHATGMPVELYGYPAHKTLFTGVPVANQYSMVSEADQHQAKNRLGLTANDRVLLVVGGGLGAHKINQLVLASSAKLLSEMPDLHIFHVAGQAHNEELEQDYAQLLGQAADRVKTIGLTDELYLYSTAADLIITRAGATALAEFAAQGKACLVIPNPHLTGGHQLKNAEVLEQGGAVAIFREEQPIEHFAKEVKLLLENTEYRRILSKKLHTTARPEATRLLADLILKNAKH